MEKNRRDSFRFNDNEDFHENEADEPDDPQSGDSLPSQLIQSVP
jgi:hypothetical protein